MFRIITDTTADLPESYLQEHDIDTMCVKYILNGESYGTDRKLAEKEFYAMMRAGQMPTTSQPNPQEAKEFLEKYCETDKEILCLSFSSGLSGTYNSARMAAEEIMEEHPDVKVVVLDTLCASLGEGLLVHKAVCLRDEGKSMQETADWVEKHKLNLVHVFTVDDLNHLYRGGRVSRAAAIVGTIAGIKPVLHVDDEGHLIPIQKIRGRKKALKMLVDNMEEKMGSFRDKNDIIFISHGDCEEDALLVQEEVKRRFGIESFLLNYIGPTIGAHSGPGTVALFFMGDVR